MSMHLQPFRFQSKALNHEQCPALLSQGAKQPTNPQSAARKPLLLSRARYRVRTFALATVPRAERRAAVRNLLLGWGPFDEADYRIAFIGDSALAFAWDRRAAAADIEAVGLSSTSRPMPEGLFRPRPAVDGLRLHACLEGYEAQVWRDGLMVESRWWPQLPSEQEWEAVLRSRLVQGVEHSRRNDATTPWQDRPWTASVALDELDRSGSEFERLLLLGVACGLVGLGAMQARDLYRSNEALQRAKSQLAELTQKASPIASARADALASAHRVKLLSGAMTAAQPLEVMQHLAEQLPKSGVALREFDLRGQTLRLTLSIAPSVQRSDVLKGLQGGGWFVDVAELREGTSPEGAVFEMRLASVQPGPAADVRLPASSNQVGSTGSAGAMSKEGQRQ